MGVRVVRGPDWKSEFGNQDGGEGHTGSIVEIGGQNGSDVPEHCVMVQWDVGEKDIYRAGYQKAYDLRLYDNAAIGKYYIQSKTRTELFLRTQRKILTNQSNRKF